MAPIIVHVGFPKSASTLLQRGVFSALEDIDFFPSSDDSEIYMVLSRIDYPGGEDRRLEVIGLFTEKVRTCTDT